MKTWAGFCWQLAEKVSLFQGWSHDAHDEFIQLPHYPSQQLLTLHCSGLDDNKGLNDKATFNLLCSDHCIEWVENRIKVYQTNGAFIASEGTAEWQRTTLSPAGLICIATQGKL